MMLRTFVVVLQLGDAGQHVFSVDVDLGLLVEHLLLAHFEATGLDGDDLGGGIGVMGDRGAAIAAEQTVDELFECPPAKEGCQRERSDVTRNVTEPTHLATVTRLRVVLDRAFYLELVVRNDDDKRIRATRLPLASIAVCNQTVHHIVSLRDLAVIDGWSLKHHTRSWPTAAGSASTVKVV